MAEDDTLFYNDDAPEPNTRDTVEVKGPWGTLTLRPSPAFAEELAQLSHIGWDGIGSPERSLEGAAVQFVQSVQTMVRIEGRDPKQGVDLGDAATNPYLRRRDSGGGLEDILFGGLTVFGGSETTHQRSALAVLNLFQNDGLGGEKSDWLLDDPDPTLRDMHRGILAGWRRLTAEANPDLGLLLGRDYDGVQTVRLDDGVERRRYDDLSAPEFVLNDPEANRSDGLSDSDIEDIVDASPGPDLR